LLLLSRLSPCPPNPCFRRYIGHLDEDGKENGQPARPPRVEPTDICKCKSEAEGGNGCDENCINRILNIECVGVYDKSARGSEQKRCNCMVGKDCGNRRLGLRETARCRPKREPGKGWGLITVDGCEKDELVSEYVASERKVELLVAREKNSVASAKKRRPSRAKGECP
jgi:hypothetical protein